MTSCSHSPASASASTWPDLLRQLAESERAKPAFRFLQSGDVVSRELSYFDLDCRARAVAVGLRRVCEPGDRALLVLPAGLDFITAFFGCLYAGVVAVPAYPPRPNESIHRLRAIVNNAGARVALTTSSLLATSKNLTSENMGDATIPIVAVDAIEDAAAAEWSRPAIEGSTLAFLQYTSGSTGQPKGVMLTHANLLANEAMINDAFQLGRDDILVSWLPLFHDMGLIGLCMQTLYRGATCLLMPPAAFLQKPLRWLQLLSSSGASCTGAPNFAYELAVRRTTPEERAALDLSRLRIAFNGSEPIHAATLELFAQTFAPCGFKRDAFLPCYGMAEASLLVTGKTASHPLVIERFDPAQLAQGKAVVSSGAEARALVSSGRVARGLEARIVDVNGVAQPEGEIGEIWVRGPSIGVGYWSNPEASEQIFRARLSGAAAPTYLRTGDLGFLRDGELFVTGRIKDLIIVRGRNLYPQDLEATTAAAHPAARAYGTAVFSIADDFAEGVIVVQEVERTALRSLDTAAVIAAIKQALLREHDLAPAAIVLVKPATVPKTSSGKTQRALCRQQFVAGSLEVVGEWRQPRSGPVETAVPQPAAAVPARTFSAAELQPWLVGRVAAALSVPSAQIDPRAPLQTLGLDSLGAVTLSGELEAHLGRPVAPTIVYDFPSIEKLAAHFGTSSVDTTSPSRTPVASGDRDTRAIAVVGIGCRFPGDANNAAAFWRLLRNATDATEVIPADRWDVDAWYDSDPETPDRMYVKRGAFVRDVDQFDPEFFGISPREAVGMDPQHRLLLEVAWEALESAGLAPTSLASTATGVFVGLSFDDYARLVTQDGNLNAHSALGSTRSLASARLSYHLGLQGPSLVVDTLCSSSLVAVHLAIQSLRTGESRVALAGGVNLMLAPETMVAASKLRALSPDGRCAAFDAAANGYARGEGAGIVVLKRLVDAVADGDPILAVLRGSAVNQDGRSNGLTAPSATAQEALLRSALADADAKPADIGYVETHGTGTILGDPIEMDALARVFAPGRPADEPLLLGTVKTNIGHLESAAGIAGLIKAILVLNHREVPANLHFQQPNPYIPWDRLPVRVVDLPLPLPASAGLVGVSSFGLSGTNAHVILEPAPQAALRTRESQPRAQLFTLSGRTRHAVVALASRWAAYIENHADVALADLCATANAGRAHFEQRLAWVVGSREELVQRLRAIVDAEIRALPTGQADKADAPIRIDIPEAERTKHLQDLADAYLRGRAIDWAAVNRLGGGRRRAGAPTYPFQRRRYWLEGRGAKPDSAPETIPTFRVEWQPASLSAAKAEVATWLLWCPDPTLAAALAASLPTRGQHLLPVERDNVEERLANEATAGLILAGANVADVFGFAQRVVATPAKRLWLLTERALGTGRESAELTLSQAPLPGFAKAFALEHPAHWGGLFDRDGDEGAGLDAFASELVSGSDDDIVAVRGGVRLVPRLVPYPAAEESAPPIRAARTYLITGGTGALGLSVARWLVAHGARHLTCLSRRPPSTEAQRIFHDLASAGADVRLRQADVANRAELTAVLREIEQSSAPLAGLFHAAGVSGFAPLTELSPEAIGEVLSPKVQGAFLLDELTRDLPLEQFVLFSSIASVWGSARQTHYAAANAALDALAHERRRCGLPALSINWGPWDDGGMAAGARDQLQRIGLTLLPPAPAVALLGRLLSGSVAQVVAARVDWPVLRSVLTLQHPQPLLAALAGEARHSAPHDTEILRRLRTADLTQRSAVLAEYLQRTVAAVLGLSDGERIEPTKGFFALGMDSLMAVELRARLESDLALTLPGTLAFDRATLGALGDELATLLFSANPSSGNVESDSPSTRTADEPIAIVGLGCRFPGGASSVEAFWELLREGRHGIKAVPADRWDIEAFYHRDPSEPGTMYVREFGFIDGVDQFDAGFFAIFPREAASMDPQQRLLLETAWEALESAGLANAHLRGSATGVFVGVSTNDYGQLILKSGDPTRLDAHFGTGNALNAVAGRLAYVFGLRGPTMVTDTACSSSLVALHQACQSLRAGECTQAIAAGVNLILVPEPTIALSRARMLSPESRCKTFDAAADGYVRGEGCGAVVLKRLSDAENAGDVILAVIRGSAVNQDGASSGFTVPNASAQQELIRRALSQAGRKPDELDYVEAHGTGTPLGDPIELNALAAVVGRDRKRPLLVGSVKTNLGHLEAAAGIAGVIKTTLALHHRAIPAHLHFRQPNPHVAWADLPLEVPTTLRAWPQSDRRRLAGVSAFGFTGTNAHIILESAPDTYSRHAAPDTPQLIPLSAKTAAALRAQRLQLAAWLEQTPDVSLVDVARTLAAGRAHHAYRETYLVGSVAELRRELATRNEVAPAVATVPPIAFVCADASAIVAAEHWIWRGLTPTWVLAEGRGLVPAGVVAGIITADDAMRLMDDPAAIERIELRAPRIAFGLRGLGRIDDARAGSRDWWTRALRGSPGAALPLAPHRELLLVVSEEEQRRQAAALYEAGYDLAWRAFSTAGARHLPAAPRYPFQRSRHWIEATPRIVPARAKSRGIATLLGQRLPLPGSSEIRFAAEYSADAPAFLDDHRLFGRVIAPGAQHVSLLVSAARETVRTDRCRLTGLSFPAAIRLEEREQRAVQLVLTPAGTARFNARLLGAPQEAASEWVLHAGGTLEALSENAAPATEFPSPCEAPEVSGREFYRELDAAGYTLGPSFRWIHTIKPGPACAHAVLQPLPETHEPDAYDVHPGLLDSCFQLLGWCAGIQHDELANGGALYIPAAIDEIRFHGRPSGSPLHVRVKLTEPDHQKSHRLRGDISLTESDGTPRIEVLGFEARRAPKALLLGSSPAAASLFRVEWQSIFTPEAASMPNGSQWSIVGRSAFATSLVERLRGDGVVAAHGKTPSSTATHVVVVLEEPDHPDISCDATATLLTIVQELAARTRKPRLWVVTRGAQALPGDRAPVPIGVAAAAGFARIVALEVPELHAVQIDLEAGNADPVATLVPLLRASVDENQLAVRGGRLFAARLLAGEPQPVTHSQPVQLKVGTYGNLDSVALQPAERRSPAPGHVEIEVRAAGVNFRDVLNALGLLTRHLESLGVTSSEQLPLGGECSGIVTAIGEGVTDVKIGDSVVAALATGSMASHVIVASRFVVPKPAALSFGEAATLPVVYLTAHYALRHLAQLRRGERVLIHAAAGGVGLAAIHVAQLCGAEVCATASPAKWPLLRQLGVTILGNSRDTEYAKEFPPVDVVLNSLNAEHIPCSLALLRPGGRFVEIGKLGIWTPEQVTAKRPDVAYRSFDLVEMARETPELIEQLLRELSPAWATGSLPPLPQHPYPLTAAPEAFRFMAQAKHRGKVVLTRGPDAAARFRSDGVYLVTGGLGGIGRIIAVALARKGAGKIVLAGRRPPGAAEADALATMQASGATVYWHAADLTTGEAVRALVRAVRTEHGPIRGVFHAAGVVDDGMLSQQTRARLDAVYRPKAEAAWHLHEATRGEPVDHFVLFSSLAAVFGSPGQSTYVAANAALDALAQHRHRLGLPALSIAWGPWATGMAGRLGEREHARLTALGLTPYSPADGAQTFLDLLDSVEPHVIAAQLNPNALLAHLGSQRPPLLRALDQAKQAGPQVRPLRDELLAGPAADRREQLSALLCRRFGELLGLPAGEVLTRDRALSTIGFDSLMAVELKSWIGGELGVEIPMEQLPGLTIDAVADTILKSWHPAAPAAPEVTSERSIEATLRADAVLPDDLQVPARNGHPPMRNVLLTGATGFLGAFLLHEILSNTHATIRCLVRARTPESGRRRILENLAAYKLSSPKALHRIVAIPGDLAEPRLGLSAGDFDELATAVDTIIHNGAWLNFFYSYPMLRAANVQGTLEVLRLACQGAAKPVHYVSTSGVFYSRSYHGQVLPETNFAERCEGHALGYSQSKWVAERLMHAAADRGLPVTIHRAPFITGDRRTGAWNSDDFICRLVRGIVALGVMPDLAATMDIVPVDYVARAIVRVALEPVSPARVFHLAPREPVPWTRLAAWLAQRGYSVGKEPYADWLAHLPALRGTEHPLAPFIPLFLEKTTQGRATVLEVFLQSVHSRLDSNATTAVVSNFGITPPVIDGDLWNTYLAALERDGMLPDPTPTHERPAP